VSGTLTLLGNAGTLRFVTNDFMYTGGDGYAIFAQGTDVLQTGDLLLDVVTDYIVAHQPVNPVVDGRIVDPALARRVAAALRELLVAARN
jgi:2',3'-cyclic-nucleotide 2'-phosphodiesterase (5'-nucleotidase family)